MIYAGDHRAEKRIAKNDRQAPKAIQYGNNKQIFIVILLPILDVLHAAI